VSTVIRLTSATVFYRYVLLPSIDPVSTNQTVQEVMVGRPERLPFDMSQLLERFPGDAALIGRLLVQDDAFRNVCEDFVLERALSSNWIHSNDGNKPRKSLNIVSSLRTLEDEIAEALKHAKQST